MKTKRPGRTKKSQREVAEDITAVLSSPERDGNCTDLQAELEDIGAVGHDEKCFALSDCAGALGHLNKLARKRSTYKAAHPREKALASSSSPCCWER